MTTKNLPGILLIFLCTVLMAGCDNKESNPLRFYQSVDEDNTVDVCFPRSEEDVWTYSSQKENN